MNWYHQNLKNYLGLGNHRLAYDLSRNLSQELNSTLFLMTGRFGLNTFDLPKPIYVVKGTVITITQINGTLGGLMNYNSDYSQLTDVQIQVDYLHDQLSTTGLVAHNYHKGRNENLFFSVVVSDMTIVNDTIEKLDNLRKPEGFECVNHFCWHFGSCEYDRTTCGYTCQCHRAAISGKYCQIIS